MLTPYQVEALRGALSGSLFIVILTYFLRRDSIYNQTSTLSKRRLFWTYFFRICIPFIVAVIFAEIDTVFKYHKFILMKYGTIRTIIIYASRVIYVSASIYGFSRMLYIGKISPKSEDKSISDISRERK